MTDENQVEASEAFPEMENMFKEESVRDTVVKELSEIPKLLEQATEQLANNNPITVVFAFEYADGKTQTSKTSFVGFGSRATMMGLVKNLEKQIGG